MRVGLCGAHRTGKTTLAQGLQDSLDINFLRTTTSEVFAENGLDPSAPMDFETRLWIQHKILDAAEQVWQSSNAFVTDRTPLDMLGYTLADIRGDTVVHFTDLEAYAARCFASTNNYFSHLIFVQPGIPLVFEEGKAALNQAYIEHLSILMGGLLADERQRVASSTLPRDVLDLDERLAFIQGAVRRG